MKLRFTPRALADFRAIIDYLQEESPNGATKVGAAIDTTAANIALFPNMGRLQSKGGVRKVVARPYPYAIYYVGNDAEDEIVVLTIQHTSRAREFGET